MGPVIAERSGGDRCCMKKIKSAHHEARMWSLLPGQDQCQEVYAGDSSTHSQIQRGMLIWMMEPLSATTKMFMYPELVCFFIVRLKQCEMDRRKLFPKKEIKGIRVA